MTDADRAKAVEPTAEDWQKAGDQLREWKRDLMPGEWLDLTRTIAHALAARAEADQLRDAMRALAEELDVRARAIAEEADSVTIGEARRFGMLGRILGMKAAAVRVRDLADGGRR